jgi:hypothetical protein
MHTPIPVPTRITIDFRPDLQPGRGWIIGATPAGSARIELVAVSRPALAPEPVVLGVEPTGTRPQPAPVSSSATFPSATFSSATAECVCPAFCERDHANE